MRHFVYKTLDELQRAAELAGTAHVRFSGDLLNGAHFVFGLMLQKQEQGITRNRSVPAGESVSELPQVDAPRQHPPKYTSVQSR